MGSKNNETLIPPDIITSKIYFIRGSKVMLDRDLAELYGVPNKRLNQQVKRNITRFPEDFMFMLKFKEFSDLKSQFVTSSWGGIRELPYVFTENGIAMLSSVQFTFLLPEYGTSIRVWGRIAVRLYIS